MSQILLLEIRDISVRLMFRDYTIRACGHLMRLPINEDESMDAKRQALAWFIDTYNTNGDCERNQQVTAAVRHVPGALDVLCDSLQSDQYFQEPLYHMLNQHRPDYIL